MTHRTSLVASIACLCSSIAAQALAPAVPSTRFAGKTIDDPAAVLAIVAIDTQSLSVEDPLRRGWEQFFAANGAWSVQLDQRTGLPTLASGKGITWLPATSVEGDPAAIPPIDTLERLARQFLDSHSVLLGRWGTQLVLDRSASGKVNERVWQVTFRQQVDGVMVNGARFDFHVEHGNLVAFGAYALGPVDVAATPTISRDAARAVLDGYLGAALPVNATFDNGGTLQLTPLDPRRDGRSAWTGPRGHGLTHALVWHFALHIPGEAPSWIVDVDAHSGSVIACYDDTRYEQIRGGVYPLSNDGVGAEGVEQPNFPMPFADYTVAGGAVNYSGDEGLYSCSSPAATVRTTLNGKFIRVSDGCGVVDQTTTCDNPLEFSLGPGTDCVVPAGSSPGNTHAARSSFYHLNLAMAKGRAWLPGNAWLQSQVVNNVNINDVCNAYWNGSVNFYKSGGGCRNTGELQGVFVHEWGHGLDANDGGGYDNTSESYADVVAIFEARLSCVGRGFFESQNCSAYGDTCLNCTGIRDMNWNSRTRHQPATPANFVQPLCGGGGGPCGREVHCESYPPSEAIFDLATRDLSTNGLDPDSAWQLAERLFYQSRQGSGGPIFNCSLPNSDGCGTNSWYHKLRLADDDDGNLANGTPHAKAIFDAFARHNLACGLAADVTNQSSGACPVLATPTITQAQAQTNAIVLTWTPVPSASNYRILRNDLGCSYAQLIVGSATAPSTTFTDDQLANGQSVFYRVQAIGANSACESRVSSCVEAGPQPLAGSIRFDRDKYGCASALVLRVVDANAGPGPLAVKVWSDTETQFETVLLSEIVVGTGKYQGSIASTPGAPSHGDNQLSVKNGDALHAEYVDVNDGAGGSNVPRQANASSDCVAPTISAVTATDISDTQATITWQSNEVADSNVTWGPSRPPANNQSLNAPTTQHAVTLTGLAGCTVYWYRVGSTDTAGNSATSDNGGQYYRFETYQDFGAGPEPCHGSTLVTDAPVVSCASALSFSLFDHDLNLNSSVIDSATLRLTSSSETTPELVTAYETGVNSNLFFGSIATVPGAPVADGQLQAKDGDTLTASYFDANAGADRSEWRFATSLADCLGPAIADLHIEALTDQRATIVFSTATEGDALVEWGTTPAFGEFIWDPTPATTHAALINQFTTCGTIYFRVHSTDSLGNESMGDNQGAPFVLRGGSIPGLYWRETFEAGAPGWVLGSEWETGPPQGLGGSCGRGTDPLTAYNNQRILGHDLSGLGNYPGDYEAGVGTPVKSVSPHLNATSWRNTKLIIYSSLNANPSDEAILTIIADTDAELYNSGNAGSTSYDYGYQSWDVRQTADGQSSVYLEFGQQSDNGSACSGWNVDDVIFKDGSKPDYAGCGGCGSAPVFMGATNAIDNNACGAGGVTASWSQAVTWGTGSRGSYSVFRATTPNFVPGASNRIAAGVAGLSYNDAAAPVGALYYVVRAENEETCSTGAANGGVVDANTVHVAVSQTTSQPLPVEVTTLKVSLIGYAHVSLKWNAVASATQYNIYRSPSGLPGTFTLRANTSALTLEDLGAGAGSDSWFYQVKAVNACQQEGP